MQKNYSRTGGTKLVYVHDGYGELEVSEATCRLIQSCASESMKIAYEKALDKLERWLCGKPLTDRLPAEYLTQCHEAAELAPVALTSTAIWFASHLVMQDPPIGPVSRKELPGPAETGSIMAWGRSRALGTPRRNPWPPRSRSGVCRARATPRCSG